MDILPVDEVIKILRQNLSPRAKLFEKGSREYFVITNSYFWGSSKQQPVGVFQPANAKDVSLVLKTLHGFPTVPFAVKAGSHIAPAGFNSTPGLLIDMSLFNEVFYHEDTKLVDIGPGILWQDVYDHLIPLNRNVNGATSCPGVGVAGFNLGGGYGCKANQFGLAMDTIKAMEVVLPTGEIIETVSETSHREIFRALKGGGNNFGIVTKWTMETHEQGEIYFVALNYEYKYRDRVQNAIWDYIRKQVPKSNVETKFEWTTTGKDDKEAVPISHAELFYDGPEAEAEAKGLFKAFLDIPYTTLKVAHTWQDMMKLIATPRQTHRVGWGDPNEEDEDLPSEFRGRYTCVMLSRYTPDLIRRIVELAEETVRTLKEHSGLQFYPDIWPGSPEMFRKSPPAAWPHGPDARFPGALFPLPIRCLWTDKSEDAYWLKTLASLSEEIRRFAVDQKCIEENVPLYYNLALDGTQVSDIYRENLLGLVNLRRQCDPDGVMDRTGGFRITVPK